MARHYSGGTAGFGAWLVRTDDGVARLLAAPHIGGTMADPHASLRDRVLQGVLYGPGESDAAVRRAAAEGAGVPADLQALVDKIHSHAYKVTDDDIARLQAKYGDDQLFEIVVSAALGASRQRLLAGLNALNDA
jgi:hypothetical protein